MFLSFRSLATNRRCGEMADAQDLKPWGRKKPCGFESHHRHQWQKGKIFNFHHSFFNSLALAVALLVCSFSSSPRAAVVRTIDGKSYEGEVFLEPSNMVSVVLNDARRQAI